MQFSSMQFSRSSRSPLTRFFLCVSCPVVLLAALAQPARGQVTGDPTPAAPAPAASSSSDVQQAQVVHKPIEDAYKRDVALSVFANYTNKTNGNFVRIDTTSAGGGMVTYRASARWWAGYEINYGYTRYAEIYNKGAYRLDNSANEITAAYLIKPRGYRGIRPFLSFGGGAMVYSPSNYGGILAPSAKPATQTLPLFVFGIGVEHNFGEHFGVRVQYRADEAKAPNFKLVALDAHTLRISDEPSVGFYYRF